MDGVDQFLEHHPNGLALCGGDVNQLDLEELSNLSGLEALIDFPTSGELVLNNCITNNEALFSRCFPIVPQMKTDHKTWSHVNYSRDLEAAVNFLHSTIERLMYECFPSKSVRMSSRDPHG